MAKRAEAEASRADYLRGYDDLSRWQSYWYQISAVLGLGGGRVLEIGIGNGTVSDYLAKSGLEVVTSDIAPALKPHCLASADSLPFRDGSFDTVLCCQVLEHLPLPQALEALKEIRRVSQAHAVISLPYFSLYLGFALKMPNRGPRGFVLRLPWPRKHSFTNAHQWEIGKRGFPFRRVRDMICECGFEVVRRTSPPLNPYHTFLILRKR